MSESLERFVELLLRSELITESQLEQLRQQLEASRPENADEDFVQRLSDSGALTEFQVAEMKQGNVDNLVVGDYLILYPIGQGGMGRVFKARHSVMKREVAVKFMLLEGNDKLDQSAIDRFQRELEAAAHLSHPNIVSSLDAGRRGRTCYLVMELVRGANLSNHVRRNGPMSVRQAYECIVQAATGLDYAHRKGVVHRDVKPSNLLLTDDGELKILDMGLVRMKAYEEVGESSEVDDPLTRSGQLLGTVDYMAPEQAVDPRMADARSDIYSLGCTFYYLLTGAPPFRQEGKSPMSRIIAHRESPVPRIGDTRSDFPECLEAIFQKMMAKDARKRYQSCRDLLADLKKVRLESQELTVAGEQTESMTRADAPAPRKKVRPLAVLALLAALAAVVGLVIYAVNPRTFPQPTPGGVPEGNGNQPPSEDPIATIPTGPVDLLAAVDLEQQVFAGAGWTLSGGQLHMPAGKPSKLCFRLKLPEQFHVKLRVVRTSSPGPFIIGMNEEGRRCFLLLDAQRSQGHIAALGTGKSGRMVITESLDSSFLPENEPVELLVDVSRDKVHVRAGDRTILLWEGDTSELGLGQGWGVGDKTGLFIGGNDLATFDISQIELVPSAAEPVPDQENDADSPATNVDQE